MSFKKLALCFATAGYLMVCGSSARALEVAQNPLFLGTDVPGNLVFVPSVEWPTILSVANLQPNYSPNTEFVGYFDSDKCYEYRYSNSESDRHFYPVEMASGRECDGDWSGNFLNWAATQTIDPFRKVLTGGLRVRDTPTETWLEKARMTNQAGNNIYPDRELVGAGLVAGATPFTANRLEMRVRGLGNRMRFRLNATSIQDSGTPFNPAIHPPADSDDWPDQSYEVAIRVAVCVSGLEEDNCVGYSSSAKPEGLIQANDEQLRYSVFGYLNDSNNSRDGAALRARQKFVGPDLPGGSNNTQSEWDRTTGVLYQNPDADDAADTSSTFNITIRDSGVINYINKFGQMTSNNHKSLDPVSELFYAAVRYIRGEDNVGAYTDGANYNLADGFPVITDWGKNGHDPVQFSCQINVALGIGDIYTHDDKNLPGPTRTNDEPTKPQAVRNDDWIDVVDVANRIGAMEGIGNIGDRSAFTGRDNSAYIAALAYWANTTDMRPGEPGKTTMSTHWVDVLEERSLEGMARNQYALATKYGGADVPDDFDPMDDSLEQDWWHTNGETLTPFGARGNGQASFLKPDNFFLAGNAASMIEALSNAFETILSETTNVVTSVSTTSTRLDTDTLAIQARFESDFWSGDLLGLDPITNAVQWRASNSLPSAAGRKILSWNTEGSGSEVLFNDSMPLAMKTRIASSTNGQPIDKVIAFLRGNRGDEANGFRRRGDTVLGDIVNSRPVLAGSSNEGWARLDSGYNTYLENRKSGRDPVVYVGGNDGMLHGFNTDANGRETMAYVPNAVLDRIGSLANPTYQHQFFVDGQIAIADAKAPNGEWKNVLVGGLGAGGKAIYAIDVTNPGSPEVLWEVASDPDPNGNFYDLGYTFGKPVINRIGDDWVAIFGNGYGSPEGRAYMYFVELFTGTFLGKVPLGDAGGNGLSGVAALSNPSTGTELIRAYAGDLNGTIWRVDFDGGTIPDDPAAGFSNGLFTDPENRPITSTPALAASPAGGLIVYVGTGKLIETTDRTESSNQPEAFWAVIDKNSSINNTNGFNEVSMTVSGGQRVIDGVPGDDGWFLELTTGTNAGERVLNQARVIFGQLIFTTFEPDDDACATGGLQRIYVLDAVSGSGRLDNQCNNCGVIEIGIGAPVEPPVVLKPPVSPDLTPGNPGGNDPDDPDSPGLPDGDTVGAVTGWCSAFGVLSPSGFLPLGNICDGRQVWRQVR